MGFRLFKRLKILPYVTLNLSKSGVQFYKDGVSTTTKTRQYRMVLLVKKQLIILLTMRRN
jgi:hypothetical protein